MYIYGEKEMALDTVLHNTGIAIANQAGAQCHMLFDMLVVHVCKNLVMLNQAAGLLEGEG